MKTQLRHIQPIPEAEVITFLGRETEGNDGETYKVQILDDQDHSLTAYVKLAEDSRKIIAELAAAQVGRALGLNVPKPFLVLVDTNEIPEEFLSSYSKKGYMLCFASKQVSERSYSLERSIKGRDPHTNFAIAKLFDMDTTVAFDELVANTDRNLGNLGYSPERQGVWMIDHGAGTHWRLLGLMGPGTRSLCSKHRGRYPFARVGRSTEKSCTGGSSKNGHGVC